ncbi:MAG: aspartate aminotransferase [Euryarchaeota archaeon HGW-Euryarchaeota-1]|nr:MAG: aspartate aminotransferase [Euryarchaeota archaeon HGW-Euryarchaeota-1]
MPFTIAKRMKMIDVSGTLKVFNLVSQYKNIISLGIGEPDFDIPGEIKEAQIKAIREGKNKYASPQGIYELREKVAEKLRAENGIDAKAEDIIITSGVSGALFLGFNVLLNEGDEVIIPDPSFSFEYKNYALFLGAKPVLVDTYPDFKMTADKIAEKITSKTKLLILNSPSNPTGSVIEPDELKKIAKLAEAHDLVVISDEIYEKFVYDCEHISIAKYYSKTITMNGFSKAYAMTGNRIGYLRGPSEIIQELVKLQLLVYVCAPTSAQYAALKAFDVDVSDKIREYKKRRDLAYEMLKDHFEVVKPKGAFYIFLKVPENYTGTEFAEKLLKEKQTLTIPGKIFSERDTHIRISFATSEETLRKGLKNIVDIVKATKN